MERPEAILVTMSKDDVKEWGGIFTLDKFFSIHYTSETDMTFWYRIGQHLPKHQDILYVYIVIHNMIRWRFNFVSFEDATDGITLYKNNVPSVQYGKYVVMTGPAIKRCDIRFRGFQGFRYSQIIF
jgi:hypothetical protein